MTATALAIEGLSLPLGAFALRNIGLKVEEGEIAVVLGPNGAGKSVLLETVAGFHRPSSGRIAIGGRDVTALAPEHRHVGFMFQNYGLFPHLTVARNVAIGLRARGGARARVRGTVADLLARFGIEPIASRIPQTLSPGEKQRVALARALASRPDIFLFDEPFSALDTLTRDTLSVDLAGFLREAGIAAIFVTHDHTDALSLSDRIAVMNRGEIVQVGAVAEVFRRPASPFVASFLGVENLVSGRVEGREGYRLRVAVGGQALLAPPTDHASLGEVLLCIRAEDVRIFPPSPATRTDDAATFINRLAARVVAIRPLGPLGKVTLECGFRLDAYVMARDIAALGIAPGAAVEAAIDSATIHVLPKA